MDVQDAALKRQEACMLIMQEDHIERLKQQELGHAARLEIEDKRLVQLTDDLKEARFRFALAEGRNKSLEDEIQGLREQLNQACLPSPETEAELRGLRTRILTLETAGMENIVRAKTLDARYRVGDLVSFSLSWSRACGLSVARMRKRRHSSTRLLRLRKLYTSKNWWRTATNCAV